MKNPTTNRKKPAKAAQKPNVQQKTPKRRRRQDLRPGEIITAARRVFIEKGFSDARIDDVAKAAGASKGTVYLYFESKEELFVAVALETIRPVLDRISHLGALETISADRVIEAMIEFAYAEIVETDRREILHMIIAEGVRFPKIAEFYHGQLISRARALLSGVIRRGIHQGVFRPDAPHDHPEILISPILLSSLWKMLFERYEALNIAEVKERHLDMVRRTLLADQVPQAG